MYACTHSTLVCCLEHHVLHKQTAHVYCMNYTRACILVSTNMHVSVCFIGVHTGLGDTVLLNYNFIFTCVSTRGATRKLQCIPNMCLCGPCFLVVWSIHISCNLPCSMRGIATCWSATCVTATQGTHLSKY